MEMNSLYLYFFSLPFSARRAWDARCRDVIASRRNDTSKECEPFFIITRFLFLEKFFIYYVLRPKHRPFKLEILSKGICRHFKYMGRICKKKYLCYERKIVSLMPDHISHTLTNTGKTNTQVERHKRTGIACCTLLSARHWIKTSPAKSKRRVRKAALGQLEDTEKKISIYGMCVSLNGKSVTNTVRRSLDIWEKCTRWKSWKGRGVLLNEKFQMIHHYRATCAQVYFPSLTVQSRSS